MRPLDSTTGCKNMEKKLAGRYLGSSCDEWVGKLPIESDPDPDRSLLSKFAMQYRQSDRSVGHARLLVKRFSIKAADAKATQRITLVSRAHPSRSLQLDLTVARQLLVTIRSYPLG